MQISEEAEFNCISKENLDLNQSLWQGKGESLLFNYSNQNT